MGSSSESTSSPSDSPGRGSDEDKSSSKTDSKNTSRGGGGADSGSAANPSSAASFDNAMDNAARPDRAPAATPDKPENDNRPGGPEGGDTTPGYSGPTPDPRGPALDDKPDDEQNEDDKPATTPSTTPGGLPDSDTTPNYTGPVNDPRGPALGGGDNGNTTPAPTTPTTPGTQDPNAPSNPVADFFGGLARDFQDFARENPRVDSYGNPVGLVDANGIQHGEVASGAMASGRTQDQLARDLGFSSPQEMSTAQNTDFIADEYRKDLTRRAVAEALNPKTGLPPDVPGAYINAFAPVLDQPPLPPTEFIPAGFQAIPPDMIIDGIMQAAELMPDIPPDVWGETAEVMKDMYAGAVNGAIQGFAFGTTTGAMYAGAAAMADGPLPGPADIAAGIGYGIYTGATTVAGAIAGGGAAAIEGLISYNKDHGYHTPPKDGLPAFPDAAPTKKKTPQQGGSGLRDRWTDSKGRIYEWDRQHGTVEVYDKTGKRHLGEFDPDTGKQVKEPDPKRRVEK